MYCDFIGWSIFLFFEKSSPILKDICLFHLNLSFCLLTDTQGQVIQNIFIDIGSYILPVLADLLEMFKIAPRITILILISLLNNLLNDLNLRRLVGILLACLLILLLFLHYHLSLHFLFDGWNHSDDLLFLLPCLEAASGERQLAESLEEG